MSDFDERIIRYIADHPQYTVEPKIDGETVQRSFKTSYEQFRRDHPQGNNRDFAACKEARMILSGTSDPNGFIGSAMVHLGDAINEDLPHEARVQHYDIAMARIWSAMGDHEDVPVALGMAFDVLLNGGGM